MVRFGASATKMDVFGTTTASDSLWFIWLFGCKDASCGTTKELKKFITNLGALALVQRPSHVAFSGDDKLWIDKDELGFRIQYLPPAHSMVRSVCFLASSAIDRVVLGASPTVTSVSSPPRCRWAGLALWTSCRPRCGRIRYRIAGSFSPQTRNGGTVSLVCMVRPLDTVSRGRQGCQDIVENAVEVIV